MLIRAFPFVFLGCLSLASAQPLLSGYAPPASYPSAAIVNFNGGGVAQANQISTYDTSGNTIDAFQGAVQQFAGSPDPNTFYWYGMGMGCGFFWNQNSKFCGFNVYSSTDLVHWTNQGQLFPPSLVNCGGESCFEPHGLYNASTGLYVFWLLNFAPMSSPANPSGYYVVTCTTPISGCTQATSPTLPFPSEGDFNLFQDSNNIAYMAYNEGGTFVVAQLTSDYTNATGAYSQKTVSIEGTAMFKFGGNYYVTGSGGCPFCTGSATYWFMASTPLGPYSNQAVMSNTSCGGQQTSVQPWVVNSSTTLMFQSELWNANVNEGLANHFFGPVTFTGTTPNTIVCSATTAVSGVNALPMRAPFGADQTDEPSSFQNICDLTGTKYRLQTFIPSHTATLWKLQLPIGQNNLSCPLGGATCSGPDGNVTVSVVTLDGSNNPVSTLWSQTLTGSGLSWTPQEQALAPNISVTGGTTYGIEESASNTVGCFSAAYSANLPYPPGIERVSSNSGSSWSTDANASLKFSVFLQ